MGVNNMNTLGLGVLIWCPLAFCIFSLGGRFRMRGAAVYYILDKYE